MVLQFPKRPRPAAPDRRTQLADLHRHLWEAGPDGHTAELQSALRGIGCFNERQALQTVIEMLLSASRAGSAS